MLLTEVRFGTKATFGGLAVGEKFVVILGDGEVDDTTVYEKIGLSIKDDVGRIVNALYGQLLLEDKSSIFFTNDELVLKIIVKEDE